MKQRAESLGADLHRREADFHDDWAASIDPKSVDVDGTFALSTSPEPQWIARRLGDLAGKRVLDLGTGAGEAAVYFAKRGAQVVATDISPGMLEVVQKVAALHGTTLETKVCSADDLSMFADASFDIVYGANVLHHVDTAKCLDEVRRVLKPGGMGGFWDPVAHNPIINIYRRMAMPVRTEDEHPIRREQMKLFRDRFSDTTYQFFWLTTLVVFLKFYVVDRVHPSKDRYWKRILREEPRLRWWYRPLAALDRGLLRIVPPLGWWCWNIAVTVRK